MYRRTMKFKSIMLIIIPFLVANAAFAKEPKKSNYFGDDNYKQRVTKKNKALKKYQKKRPKNKRNIDSRELLDSKPVRFMTRPDKR